MTSTTLPDAPSAAPNRLPEPPPGPVPLGEAERPRWARPALAVLLLATAGLYLWDLSASGWGNSFYAAAVQAGSDSWKAFFFGASDAAASITVDKTPMSLWVMALSVRVFGLSSWSMLVPQALMGVASVGLLAHTVRRATGSHGAGLLAGVVLATTPVAALMFRFDNPDALLVLLLVGSAAATLRGVELATPETSKRALRWLVLAGALVGFAFLTKMLQAFLVLPVYVLVYAVEARLGWGRKLGHLLAAFAAMVVAAGWWIALVEFWPGTRPYIGGSQTNSILELTLGYNGFGRLTGNETGSVGGGGQNGTGMWGETGLLRMFDSEIGGQISWLLPAALLLLGAGVVLTARRPRGDRVRAGLIVWGGWLLVTGLTFSLMAGIFHAYYTVALAPAVGAVVGIGGHLLWQRRHEVVAGLVLSLTVAASTAWAFTLLTRSADFVPWLRWAVLVVGLGSALALALASFLPQVATRVAVGAALVAVLAGPTAYTLDTVTTPHTGSIPTAGPSTGTGFGGPGGGFGGPPPGVTQNGTGTTQNGTGTTQNGTGPGAMMGGGAAGGLLNGSTPSDEMVALLMQDADQYTWVAATVGANTASGYQLATERSVMPIGGFNGTDPSPTLAEFQAYVDAGEIHYFIAGGGFGGGFGGGPGPNSTTSTSSSISTWVAATFSSTTVDGVTVYDLTSPLSSSSTDGGAS